MCGKSSGGGERVGDDAGRSVLHARIVGSAERVAALARSLELKGFEEYWVNVQDAKDECRKSPHGVHAWRDDSDPQVLGPAQFCSYCGTWRPQGGK